MLNFPFSSLLNFFSFLILHEVQNSWILELWTIRLEGEMMQKSFHRSVYTQYNACPLGPDVPSSLGALEWGLLVHLALIFFFFVHELTLNVFLAFPGIFWLGCQLPCRQDLHQCPFSFNFSLSLSPLLLCFFFSSLSLFLSAWAHFSLPLLSILRGIIETLV